MQKVSTEDLAIDRHVLVDGEQFVVFDKVPGPEGSVKVFLVGIFCDRTVVIADSSRPYWEMSTTTEGN
jgi:hypothetical protein